MEKSFDIIIVGGGPAGYTAALYAARAGLSTLVLEKMAVGGQMTLTGDIDNYPGLIADEVYDDFEDSGRWSIGKAYILKIDDDYYRVWEEVGLTEMQPNDWWDQTPQKMVQRERMITEWITVEEDM